jgi:hypothetical protein
MNNLLRRSGFGLLSSLFAITLFMAANSAVFHFVFSNPETIKGVLDKSGVYNDIVGVIVDEQKQKAKDNPSPDQLPLDDPAVKDIAEKALNPTILKTNADKLIDGTYRWLDGTVAQPDFVLDLTEVKQNFISGVGQYAEQRVATLPACTAAQLQSLGSFDAVTAPCLPHGITPMQARLQAEAEATKNQDFLKETTITPANITSETGGADQAKSNPFDNKQAPENFQRAKGLFWPLLIITLLLATAAIFVNPSRRAGMKKIGITLLVISVIIIAIPLLIKFVLSRLSETSTTSDIGDKILLPLFTQFNQATSATYFIFGGIGAALALALLFGARLRDGAVINRFFKR